MRSPPFIVALALSAVAVGAQAQPVETVQLPLPLETVAEAEETEPEARPIAVVPVLSEPLPAIATGAPVRLDPYKPAAVPRRPLPTSQPATQARPR